MYDFENREFDFLNTPSHIIYELVSILVHY